MLDIMLSLADFVATLALIRFFKTEKTSDAAWFGVATSVALLVKGNATALVAMPVVMILVLRRWAILKKPGLYVSALVIVVLGLPWQLLSMRLLSGIVSPNKVSIPYVFMLIGKFAACFPEPTS